MSLIGKVLTFDNILPQEDATVISNYMNSLSFNDKSHIFKISTGEYIVSEDIRSSHSVVIDDSAVLSLIRKTIIDRMQTVDPGITSGKLLIRMASNYVTFIKYEKDGFFPWQPVYQSFLNNQIRTERGKWIDCHLIYCIEEPVNGGQLEVKMNKNSIVAFPMYQNTCIIFDKSIEHRSCPVFKGRKIIMAVDVLVSTTYIMEHKLDMELVDYVAGHKSFLSYDINILRHRINDAVAFLVLEFDPVSIIYIFDSKGLYYVKKYNNDIEWKRGCGKAAPVNHTESMVDFDYMNMNDILCTEIIKLYRNDLQNVNLNEYNPIPEDMDIKILLSLPRLHKLVESKKIEYTNYDKGVHYSSINCNELIGMLY